MDNKHRKLIVIKQSKECKRMLKMHGPAGEFMRSPPNPLAAMEATSKGRRGMGGREEEGTYF